MEDYEKYTWIIGDIHGVCDPLRALINYLDRDDLNKFVFVGDYLDHGPSSKEVLDVIMSLGDKAVTLMGNHELLALDTLYDERHRRNYGNRIWEENGCESTVRSFGFPDVDSFAAGVDPKYTDFLKGLQCFHVESIPFNDEQQLKFLVAHAGLMPNVPVEEQLTINSYEAHNQYMRDHHIWIEDSFIWVRGDFLNADPKHWEGYMVIHGHTPTHILPHSTRSIKEGSYDPMQPYIRYDSKGRAVSIDVDTGAAFGNRLTAVGLSPKNVRGLTTPSIRLEVVQVDFKTAYYRAHPIKQTTLELNFPAVEAKPAAETESDPDPAANDAEDGKKSKSRKKHASKAKSASNESAAEA